MIFHSTGKMGLPNSVQLPDDAIREIVTFMSRKQLISLTTLSLQFARILHSMTRHHTTKPLRRFERVVIEAAFCSRCFFGLYCRHEEGVDVNVTIDHFPKSIYYTLHEAVDLDPILCWKWLRFEELYIKLPGSTEVGRAWLKSLLANSHCLRGCDYLEVSWKFGRPALELTELIDELKRVVAHHKYLPW